MTAVDTGRELVRRWRSGATQPGPAAPGPAPMSAVQRGILIFERLRPCTAVFNLSYAVRHLGRLDDAQLDAAFGAILRRHPALRSRFADGPDGPVRTIAEPAIVQVRWRDLRSLSEPKRFDAARAAAEHDAAEAFDLERGPLVRVHGYRLGDDERLLVFVAHHLVFDGASFDVVLAELDAAYRGELVGVLADPLSVPSGTDGLGHWQRTLAGLPDLDLPTDHPHLAEPTFGAGSVPLAVPPELTNSIDRLAAAEGGTTFMVVLAAFGLLLSEQTGQRDFGIGTPYAGRSRAGHHSAVGLLSDLLVLRVDLSDRPTFRDLVRRARIGCLDAFAHGDVPFEDIVAALAPGRHVGGALVRATLAYHGARRAHVLAGTQLTAVPLTRVAIRRDVEVHVWRDGDVLAGSWDYATDLFSPPSATRLAQRLPILLARVLAEPDRSVDELDVLDDGERLQLSEWADGPDLPGPDVSLPQLITAQAALTPDAPAVRDRRHTLTYRHLEQRANQLAHHLAARGFGAGDVVGLHLPRDGSLIVAMLGVLKTGAAYLPLDPAYPAERTELMVSDSGARAVITIDDLRAAETELATPLHRDVSPDQLAYVLYTSGSTGRPKGVLVTHGNVTAMARWGAEVFTAEQLSRVLCSTSACFDVSHFEIYVPLGSGGTVVIVDNALSLLTESPDVTMLCSVPSAVRALLAAGALPSTLLAVGLGGEAVTGTIADDVYGTGHVEVVANVYGPTEDTTYSTYANLRRGESPSPIGAVLPGGRGHVLDAALRRVPIGAVGELYLGGHGLTIGYHEQPGLTASRYIADPYGAAGQRMYRTGDLVRHRADGALLYLGRRDFQVKIRGQRIELGEIESVLQQHPDVRDAVVTLIGEQLIGYVTARAGAPDIESLREHARRAMPVAMVPNCLVVLDALPLLPNGKVDRTALPESAMATASGAPPEGPLERIVAEVWCRVLGRDSVSRDDDFFDLGGNSLLAGQVLTGLRARTGADLALRLIFERTRLVELAATLGSQAGQRATTGAVVPARDPDASPVLSYEQQRVWLESMVRPGCAYNVHGRRLLHGDLDVALLRRCVAAIVDRHEALRTTFPIVAGRPVPRVAIAGPDLRVQDVSGDRDPSDAAERLADNQSRTVFDLTNGPLFDCLLVQQAPDRYLLSVTVHHIVSDGSSIGIFVRELSSLYSGADEVAPLTVQYLDYAAWQRARLTGVRLQEQVEAWQERLAGAPPALNLPVTNRREPGHGAIGGRVRALLDATTTGELDRLCRDQGATPFMAFTAALAVVLRRWSGQDDLVVGVPVSTRPDEGTDAVIGFFVNTVPVRVRIEGNPSFAALLRTVHTAALESFVTRGETPFDVLVRELHVVRDPSRSPLFQVQLSMIDTAEDAWKLRGVQVTPADAPPQPSKCDLSLDVISRDDGGHLLELSYFADRYDEASMRAFVDQLIAVLTLATRDPQRPVLGYVLEPGSTSAASARAVELTPVDGLAVPGDAADPEQHAVAAELAGAATLAVPATARAIDPTSLPGLLGETAASAVYLTPPLLRALIGAGHILPPGVRHVFVENRGDFLVSDVERLRRATPASRLHGVYRPSHGAGRLICYEVKNEPTAAAPLRVPIGHPVDGVRMLGPGGAPAVVGEIAQLHAGERWSGDLARMRPDGMLEFAPPATDPIETVAALLDVSGVQDAVVFGAPAVACVADPYGRVDPARLRQHLVTHLPEYLIPERVEIRRGLPLTPNGRYDLAALAPTLPVQPEPRREADMTETAEPTAPTVTDDRVQQVLAIMRTVLDRPALGPEHDVMDYGGTSLSLVRILAEASRSLGVDINPRELAGSATARSVAGAAR